MKKIELFATSDLHGNTAALGAVNIDRQNALIFTLLHNAIANGDTLRSAQHHGNQMRVRVHRLRAAKLPPGLITTRPVRGPHTIIKVVVEVWQVGWGQVQKVLPDVVDQSALHFVDGDGQCRVFAEHGDRSLFAAALGHDGLDLWGDVKHAHGVVRFELDLLVVRHELHAHLQTGAGVTCSKGQARAGSGESQACSELKSCDQR